MIHDKNKIPLLPGDLIRTPHFIDNGSKKRFIYHIITKKGNGLYMTPAHWLESSSERNGGEMELTESTKRWIVESEIVAGHGNDGVPFWEREKVKE